MASIIQRMPMGFMHIGGSPILFSSPGTQTHSFVPLTRTVMEPSRFSSAIVASLVTCSGPERRALLTLGSSAFVHIASFIHLNMSVSGSAGRRSGYRRIWQRNGSHHPARADQHCSARGAGFGQEFIAPHERLLKPCGVNHSFHSAPPTSFWEGDRPDG